MGLNRASCISFVAFLVLGLYAEVGVGQANPRSIATAAFYNALLGATSASCAGKNFYTYNAFIGAAESTAGFGTTGSDVVRKREVAAFLANVMHETGGLCYISETNPGTNNYCDPSYRQWPCTQGKRYFGRGPLQISWNYNYGAAGRAIGFDGLNNPEIVGQNPTISYRTAYWFWMNNVHNTFVNGGGFGSTIRRINSGECNGGRPAAVNSRVNYYRRFCQNFGVDPGPQISC
eukprot:TRINITY_DN2853_c0_g1_i1.p1 TRINITY_DN2853_c0_g1~~TRINITY_DN2853_c0_g1_i1.p1  ORF type:complete len:233 (-),score=23.94 TRINITY_DN2853_c0_g1_i1:113-811(-)